MPQTHPSRHHQELAQRMYQKHIQCLQAGIASETHKAYFEEISEEALALFRERIDKKLSSLLKVCQRMKHKGRRQATHFTPETVCPKCEVKTLPLEELRREFSPMQVED